MGSALGPLSLGNSLVGALSGWNGFGMAILEHGAGMMQAGCPSFLSLGVGGQSYFNFLVSTASTVFLCAEFTESSYTFLQAGVLGPQHSFSYKL